jgi:triosephosphate isomerase (TIM)
LKGPIIINCKNYLEIAGERIFQLAEIAQDISEKYKIEIMIAPPQNSLFYLSQFIKLPLICQHIDNEKIGPTTGYIIPELARSYGASGSLINHSEHRLDHASIQNIIERLRQLNMLSIVCASTSREVGELARFNPEMIAIEPPELIGTGKAVSKVNPSIITESVKEARIYSKNIKVICGAGIVDQTDIQSAINLGSEGILLASGLIKSESWKDKLIELSEGFE